MSIAWPTIWIDNRNHKPISLNREIGKNSIQMFLSKWKKYGIYIFANHQWESFVGVISGVQRFCASKDKWQKMNDLKTPRIFSHFAVRSDSLICTPLNVVTAVFIANTITRQNKTTNLQQLSLLFEHTMQ